MTSVAVVGGGLAGLGAARRLAEAGLEVRLFERRSEVGGRVRTRRRDGFTLDRGFQVLFAAYPAARRELDLGTLSLRAFSPGATIARPGRRSTLADPLRDPAGALGTLRCRDVSQVDKLRLFALQRELRGRSPETVFPGPRSDAETYLRDRGFSRRFVERFAAPFFGGITLDRSLSTAAAVFEYTFKMLGEGEIAVPAAGMGAIPAQLADAARAAGSRIVTGTEVVAVDAPEQEDDAAPPIEAGSGAVVLDLDGETMAADAAVVATDPPTARSLTGVESIPTAARGCTTQYLSLPDAVELDHGGRLILNARDARPNHVAPMSAVAPEYAPEGRQLLAATFLGESGGDDDLTDDVRAALGSWFPAADLTDLEHVHTDRIQFAQFEQPPGIHGELPDTDAPAGPVFLAGDYTRWSSIQGALSSGRDAAEAVIRASGAVTGR